MEQVRVPEEAIELQIGQGKSQKILIFKRGMARPSSGSVDFYDRLILYLDLLYCIPVSIDPLTITHQNLGCSL